MPVLTCRVNASPDHFADVEKDDGDRANRVAQGRVGLDRSPSGFLVGSRRVVAALFDDIVEAAVRYLAFIHLAGGGGFGSVAERSSPR